MQISFLNTQEEGGKTTRITKVCEEQRSCWAGDETCVG
jgi:hypothetical protein